MLHNSTLQWFIPSEIRLDELYTHSEIKKQWHVFFEAFTGLTLKAASCIIRMKIEADASALITP